MNNDRELLELAAKAAGYQTNHSWNAERLLCKPPVIGLCIKGVATNWNPLTDDGDALRLAVKLNIRFAGEWDGKCIALHGVNDLIEESLGDPYSATRRAIVRAAAEIGKEMK